MYLIDESYFIKELTIPNVNEVDVNGGTQPLGSWIDKEARLFLQNALGFDLFNDLDSNITNGSLDDGADQKWKDLVNGVDYTYSNVNYKWKGLIYEEGTFKGSILAHYTYLKWLEYQLSRMSGVGEVKGNAANSQNVNSTYRYVTLWNTFVELNQGKLNQTATYYYHRNVLVTDWYGGESSNYVSLIDFLNHKEDDYPDAAKFCYNYQNTFGL